MIDSDDEKDSGVDEVIDTSILDQSDDEMIEDNPILGGVKRPVPLLESSEEPKKKKRKKSQKCKVCGDKGHWKKDCEKLPEERRQELQVRILLSISIECQLMDFFMEVWRNFVATY